MYIANSLLWCLIWALFAWFNISFLFQSLCFNTATCYILVRWASVSLPIKITRLVLPINLVNLYNTQPTLF